MTGDLTRFSSERLRRTLWKPSELEEVDE